MNKRNDKSARPSRRLRRVDRAIADARRGVSFVVTGEEESSLCLATEMATDAALVELAKLGAARPLLALTRHRAAILHVKPTGDDVVRLTIRSWMDAAILRSLADATHDLQAPLRGPLDRERGATPESVSAGLQLAKLARLLPSVVSVPIDARDVVRWSARHDLLHVSVADIHAYEETAAQEMQIVAGARVPLEDAENVRIQAFRPPDGGVEHLAVIVGDPRRHGPVLVRLHSECFTGDLLGSLKCDCGDQLRGAIRLISEEGGGVLLYLAQEGRGIGLINKLRAYNLQDQGFDTIDANERLGFEADERLFRPAAEMLHRMGIGEVRLLTNNPDKVEGLRRHGISVVERVAHSFPSNKHNELYLDTKRKRSGHYL
jgi:GTP cyclohydrolase II